jgi:very-short-patch-repair endonuclease
MKDTRRDKILRELGFQVLRFDSEIGPGRMIAAIRKTLAAKQAPSPGP